MSKWISIKDITPELYEYYYVLDNKGFISIAVYTIDSEWDGTRDENYFAEVDVLRFENGKYYHQDTYGEVLNVTHYYKLPLEGLEDDRQ